jgi:chemotaxis protein CheD
VARGDVLFGLGDLADRMAELVGGDAGTAEEGAAPADRSGSTEYVHVGQLFASPTPCRVTTILGSCVSVCLWDPASGAGGINHFLLPQCVENGISSPRFGNVAIHRLLEKLESLGSARHRLKAKVFGGASVIDAFQSANGTLGMKNVDLARTLLQETGIPIVAEDVGGTQGRKLVFQTGDGTAWVRRI